MTTINPRVNITLEPNAVSLLALMAKQEHKSVSSIARELILEALERREDIALSALARIRDTEKQKTIKHDQAWEDES
jgi:predicted DNA-binding protein